MNTAFKYRTICEIIREVNDLHQGERYIDIATRRRLVKIQKMAKAMAGKLEYYKRKLDQETPEDYFEKFGKNEDYEQDINRRQDHGYKIG